MSKQEKVKHKISKALVLLMTGVCLLTQSVSAKTYYTTEVTNYVHIGDINISLNEYGLDSEGNEVPFTADQRVYPGQRVTEIVRVENKARDAWIRIKAELVSDKIKEKLDDSMLHLSSDLWVKRDQYYYYTIPVKHGEEVDFMDQVTIPWEWTEEYSNELFKLILTAEAVQSEHFTPNFYSPDPWFGTLIEQCVHDSYIEPATILKKRFEVIFEGGANGLVRTADDFFANWGELMPGDTETGYVNIKNEYDKSVMIDFRTESTEDNELLKNLYLRIQKDNTIIYEGQLAGSVERPVDLGTYRTGEDGRLDFTLTVPEYLTNKFAMSTAHTKWIFRAVLVDEDEKDKDKDENKDNSSGSKDSDSSKNNKDKSDNGDGKDSGLNKLKDTAGNAIKDIATGDNAPLFAFAVIAIVSLIVVALLGRRKPNE